MDGEIMKRIAVILSLAAVLFSSGPALAEDSTNLRGIDVSNRALALAPASAPSSPPSEGGLITSHTSKALKGVSVSSSFRNSKGQHEEVEISPKYASSSWETSLGRSTSISSDGLRTFVGSTTTSTMQIIAQTETAETTSRIEYLTSLTGDTYLLDVPNVGIQILAEDGRYLGTLAKPWAFDNESKPLKTWLTLDSGTLVQHISVNKTTSYPVLSDPNWGYSVDIWLNDVTIRASSRSPNAVTAMLKSCFNCFFPVDGAPVYYPYIGQSMPLKIVKTVPPYDVAPAPVRVDELYKFGWRFVALPGHVDGAGSTIKFVWYPDSNGLLHLAVVGSIVNPDPCGISSFICQLTYPSVARTTWQKLFNNVTF
jgi:hypothetical protein